MIAIKGREPPPKMKTPAEAGTRARDQRHIGYKTETENKARGLANQAFTDLRALAARIPDSTITGSDGLTFRPPWHKSRQDRSASLRLSRTAPGGFIINSFSGDNPLALRDYVKGCLDLETHQAVPPVAEPDKGRDEDKTRRALAIWNEGKDPRGTRVELYLRNRSLTLPENAAEVFRYHPRTPFGPGVKTPCMVALVRSIAGDAPMGIHRTALTGDGFKSLAHGEPKRILGPLKGGAVKLTPDDAVGIALGVAEGIETALSMRRAPEFGETPAWALLNTANLTALPVLGGVETLWIAADNDPAGLKAAYATRDRWKVESREIFVIKSRTAGADLNDCFGGSQHG